MPIGAVLVLDSICLESWAGILLNGFDNGKSKGRLMQITPCSVISTCTSIPSPCLTDGEILHWYAVHLDPSMRHTLH